MFLFLGVHGSFISHMGTEQIDPFIYASAAHEHEA